MKYNDSKVAALALHQILNGVKILKSIDIINDNERCAIWLNTVEYNVGHIANELTHPYIYNVGSEIIGFSKNAIEKLANGAGERAAISTAALDCLGYLEEVAKAEEDGYQISKMDELERKLNEQRKLYDEFLQENGFMEEYKEFINRRKNKSIDRS